MIGRLWRAWCAVAGALGAVVATMLVALAAAGALRPDRLQAAAEALRGEVSEAPRPAPADDPEIRRQAEASLDLRREEIERLEARLAARQTQLDADRARAVEAEARLRAERERVEAQRALVGAGEAEAAANAAIFDRMEPAELIDLLKRWDNAGFVRHLRAMRPSRAAEILGLLQSDTRYEDFRRPPPGAPKGASSRLDEILAQMKS